MPSCDWVGHHHTPVWCADFHSELRERWEKAESVMMYDIKSEAQSFSGFEPSHEKDDSADESVSLD